jgi:hypothetical protein
MKTILRKSILAGVVALPTVGAAMPACAQEIGIDRSNLTTQSAAVQEKTLQNIRALHATWFRDALNHATPQTIALSVNEASVARVERSVTREQWYPTRAFPDCASLHPGYEATFRRKISANYHRARIGGTAEGCEVARAWKRPDIVAFHLVRPASAVTLIAFWSASSTTLAAAFPPVEYGVDRPMMNTQFTLAFPQEPNVWPFLAAEYNKPGNFEARRVFVLDRVAQIHAQWFRDGIGDQPPEIFADLVKLVHARGMKLLAPFGPVASDYANSPGAYINKEKSGCPWGTSPLSKINLDAFQKRLESNLAAVRAVNETVDAFEVGAEMDLYCNNADSPTNAEWAKHQWKWFLSPDQVQTWVRGYGPFLAASVASIRKYFPQAKIITHGSANPTSAPLIEALAHVRGADGKVTDYTKLVDGYGAHIYPSSNTTLKMVEQATKGLLFEAAHYPHLNETPIWITEWNPSGSYWWTGSDWYFGYNAHGQPGGNLNKADPQGVYPAMDRASAIRVFNRDVIGKLRSSPTTPVNISHVFYYSYDRHSKSPKCDHFQEHGTTLPGFCNDGVTDPANGNVIPDVAAAVAGATH